MPKSKKLMTVEQIEVELDILSEKYDLTVKKLDDISGEIFKLTQRIIDINYATIPLSEEEKEND